MIIVIAINDHDYLISYIYIGLEKCLIIMVEPVLASDRPNPGDQLAQTP